jgi:hypothetical protein
MDGTGRQDLTVIGGSYSASSGLTTLRVSRKLNTGDKYDRVITKGLMTINYAWCDPTGQCAGTPDDRFQAHSPTDWNVVDVDWSGRHSVASGKAVITTEEKNLFGPGYGISGTSTDLSLPLTASAVFVIGIVIAMVAMRRGLVQRNRDNTQYTLV